MAIHHKRKLQKCFTFSKEEVMQLLRCSEWLLGHCLMVVSTCQESHISLNSFCKFVACHAVFDSEELIHTLDFWTFLKSFGLIGDQAHYYIMCHYIVHDV